jgi:hypothetical protein
VETLTLGAVFHSELQGLQATDSGRQGGRVSWTPELVDSMSTGYVIRIQKSGETTWTDFGSTDADAGSFDLIGLEPGGSYTVEVERQYSDGTYAYADTPLLLTPTLTGTDYDWTPNQLFDTAEGGKLGLSWSADTIYVGMTSASGGPVLVPGENLLIGIDTDPDVDATGGDLGQSTAGGYAYFPFDFDYILGVSVGADGSVATILVDGATFSPVASPTAFGAQGTFDAVQIGAADLGSPSRIRIAAMVTDANGTSLDLGPKNPLGTDVVGFHSSLTSSLDTGSGLWDAASGLDTVANTTFSQAQNLVTFTVYQPDAVIGKLKIRGDIPPFDLDTTRTDYTLVDDGQHGDGAAGDGIYGGVFNLDGSGKLLSFKFVDDATYPGVCDQAPCAEPTFNAPGVDRVWRLGTGTESLPTVTWNEVYSATQTLNFRFFVSATAYTPLALSGNVAELGNWQGDCTPPYNDGPPFYDTGAADANGYAIYATASTLTGHDFVAQPLHFQASYGACSWEGARETSADHVLDDDILSLNFDFMWVAGDGTDF